MKSTKKLLSLLLVFVMIFSLAVPVFAEGEPVTASKVETVADGDQVVIYYASGKVMTAESYTYTGKTTKDELVAADASVVDGKMTVPESAVVLTAKVGENGKYSFVTADGKYLYADGTHVRLVAEADANTLFQLESAEGGTLIKCDSAVFNGNAQYLEFYSGYFTVFGIKDSNEAFLFQFFKIDAPETPVEPGELDGKTVILHSNDVHGAIAGYANMAALAAEYEAKGATVIVADAGDFSQGTVYVSSSKGADAVSMMNAAGYDIAIPGNHEFDYGYAQLVENLKSAKFDTICCNILDADGNLVFAPSKVVDVDGVKIGFIGVNTPESQTKANPALIKGLKWLAGEGMVKAVQAEADKLADTVDVTIVISHLGVDDSSVPNTSYDLLKGLNGVDFIIDGHSHTVMTAGDNKEPIQSTGTAFANIGVIVIDNEKKAIESNELVEITKDSAKDETVAAAAQAIIDKIDAEYGEVFAKSDVDLNGERSVDANGVFGNRDGETNLGDLITDSMIWQVKQNLDGITVPAENIVAITNGGGIRAAIAKGDITKKDVNTVLPFGNTIAVVYVTGAELLEALEASTYCSPYSTIGGYPQVAGIEMTINPDKAYDANEETYPGSTYYGPKTINRVTIDSINGKAFDEKATYAVVTNNFCAAGGDTYYAFASASAQFDTGIPLDEALMSYITDELKGVVGETYAEPQGRINYHVHDFEDGHGTCNTCGFAPFSDIANSGYCDYIVVGWAAGIVGGYPDGTFRPNNEVTRGQFITMLWRACGEPEAENAKLSFTDAANIPDDYKAAVAWGVEAGIIYGYGDNTFRHGTPISRAQMATFSYRLMDVIFEEGSFDAFKTPFGFNDDAAVAADYVDGVNVCANLGVITGYPDGFFRPNATGTRGQAATIILRLVLTIGELVEG
ncbi:MAG: 5'-nucleotidase C-terminal domain-containing protein [Oscillospiraceae bacterium]|nr:5'-nucleotidase C-terminal domain-containing protein [Oscillospiraceae bacterium]